MDGHPLQPPGPGSVVAGLAAPFHAAVRVGDLSRARDLLATAAEAGVPSGRLYVDVVRPALARDHPTGAGTAVGIGEAVLNDLVARVPAGGRGGARRAAVIACRTAGIEALDGRLAQGYLDAGGWSVQRLGGDGLRPWPAELRHGAVELAVAVVAGPDDALRLAPACTELRRLADPPVIVLCDFSGASIPMATPAALGADAVVHDPDELMACAAGRLPAPGRRRWGVRLRRSGDTLLLTPTGCLNATSAERLADVALTRLGSYSRLVLDLGEVAEIEADGVRALVDWPELLPPPGVELRLLSDTSSRAMLDRTGVDLAWSAG